MIVPLRGRYFHMATLSGRGRIGKSFLLPSFLLPMQKP